MTLAIEKNNRSRYWVLEFGCLERLALNLESSIEDVSIGAADVLKSIARKDEELQLRVASRCSAGLTDMLRSKSQKKMLASAACTWNMITHNDPAKELVHERGFVPLLYGILTAQHHQYTVKHAAAGALVNLGNNKSCIATIRGLTDVEALLNILKDPNSTGVLQCKVAELLGENTLILNSFFEYLLPILTSADLILQFTPRQFIENRKQRVGHILECGGLLYPD
jgi:hypothetical protein